MKKKSKRLSRSAIDKIRRIIDRDSADEIDRLRAQIEETGRQGRALCGPHGFLTGNIPHEIFDFLQSL